MRSPPRDQIVTATAKRPGGKTSPLRLRIKRDFALLRLCEAPHKRKNYLFMGSDAGGERAAAIYSLVETAKLNGLDPQGYLREVLTRFQDPLPHVATWQIVTTTRR